MTHDELIEAVAKAICEADKPAFEKRERWPIIGTVLQAQFKGMARAAIRVIAPAVLRDALGEMTVLEIAAAEAGMTDYVNAFRDANQAVRAMKTRYEQ